MNLTDSAKLNGVGPHPEALHQGQGLQPPRPRNGVHRQRQGSQVLRVRRQKLSLAVTHKEGFVVGILAFPDNPYDRAHPGRPTRPDRKVHRQGPSDHLRGQGVQEARHPDGTQPSAHQRHPQARLHPEAGPPAGFSRGTRDRPHMKNDGQLGQNFLNGMQGDAMNASLCGAGNNLREILAKVRLGLYRWVATWVHGVWWARLMPCLRL